MLGRRDTRAIVTVRNVTDELFRLVPLTGHRTFTYMRRYVYRFLSRNRLSIRRITRNVSLSDSELQRRCNLFFTEIGAIQESGLETLYINMDQTAVFHNMAPRTSVDITGAQSVTAISRGTSDRITVALTVCSNGDKLPPLIIFKGTENGLITRQVNNRSSPLPQSASYAVQSHA